MVTNSTVMINEANVAFSLVNPIILKIVIAILIFMIGFVVGKIVQKLVLNIFRMSELDNAFKKKTGIKVPLSMIAATVASYFIYIVAIVMSLNRLEIATTVVTTVVIILIVVLILFVIFGMNDIFANLTAGFAIKFKGNIKPGDYIRVKGKNIEGYIISVNSLNIRLETKKDEIVFIPNMVLFKSEIIKPTKLPKK